MKLRPLRFINSPIHVSFVSPPLLEKKPGCPDTFTWNDEEFQVANILNEWHDYQRRGRMARNMSPTHAATAQRRGSWGVGQDYYRVLTKDGRYFDIFYDRAPKDVDRRKGEWFVFRELIPDSKG
jgi:hypothetical protein